MTNVIIVKLDGCALPNPPHRRRSGSDIERSRHPTYGKSSPDGLTIFSIGENVGPQWGMRRLGVVANSVSAGSQAYLGLRYTGFLSCLHTKSIPTWVIYGHCANPSMINAGRHQFHARDSEVLRILSKGPQADSHSILSVIIEDSLVHNIRNLRAYIGHPFAHLPTVYV